MQIQNPGQVAGLYPHQLSGGMQQRVAIAIALAPEPDLIVLDEPTTALDVTVQHQILELLADLQQRRGTAYLLISHDIHLVSGFADRIAVMRGGEILETGSVRHLTETPAHDYTRHLLASALAPVSVRETAAVSSPALLRVSGLGHRFRNASNSVLQEISFDIAPGRCLGLIGESGSGKSTIGKLICGIHDLQDGQIEMAGSGLPAAGAARSLEQRNLVRMVFQSPDATLNPAHRVGDILKRASYLAGAPDPGARMRALFDLVRLPPELASRYPAGLSGGQKQRVAIARAFASSPKLVVLDEPTSALDATVPKEVLSLLQELQHREQVAFLLITHDLSILPGMADDLVVLKERKIVEKGQQNQVLNAPRQAYTRGLIEAGNLIF
ncbi:ATP-binding cassette domain-containing protein [Rhodobacter sp. 24-YEA-8]|uniref:ATP-binding cassette domain-containing protein n=1 Tax=Rhodobacter sp. 24-YEA-8 TaxID=1884310 RepID=UPI001C0E24ED|nr:ATP-binding cassette domain-containing protein [Rhodobacter sp. 24-YEA-8]